MPGTAHRSLPRFDDLPLNETLQLRHSWQILHGDLGTVARSTPEVVVAAASLVTDGTVVPLNLPITEPDPPLFGRDPVDHQVFAVDRNTLDDRIDFHPQGSSQWDGLLHIRAREHGFFGGVQTDDGAAGGRLGIDHWARHGIVGRGVLLDIVAHRERIGRPYDPLGGEAIQADELRDAAGAQGVALQTGDVICIRTGWIESYRALDARARGSMAQEVRCSGLAGSEDVARFLWNAGACAVGADNPTLEVVPGDRAVGSLHRRLIPMLGFAVAELLDLGRLAALCATDGRWDFMFVAAPLNVPGGIGSPANAVAIR